MGYVDVRADEAQRYNIFTLFDENLVGRYPVLNNDLWISDPDD